MADLITSTRAKQAINLSSYTSQEDTNIDSLVSAFSAFAIEETGRDFTSTTYEHRFRGDGTPRHQLRQYPLISVDRVMTDLREVATLRYSGSGEKAWAYATDAQLTTISSSAGTETQTDSTFAASNDLTALAAVIDALTGWDMTVESAYAGWPTADVPAQVIGDCQGRAGSLRMFTELVADVNPDIDRGILWKGCGCFSLGVDYRVKYTAGYATVPEDVQEAVAQAVAWAFYFQRESQVQISSVTGSSGDAETRWIWEKVPSRLKQLLRRRRSLTGF